ncbi:unnamed protein product, partial [Symbiodinium microadriaticum]
MASVKEDPHEYEEVEVEADATFGVVTCKELAKGGEAFAAEKEDSAEDQWWDAAAAAGDDEWEEPWWEEEAEAPWRAKEEEKEEGEQWGWKEETEQGEQWGWKGQQWWCKEEHVKPEWHDGKWQTGWGWKKGPKRAWQDDDSMSTAAPGGGRDKPRVRAGKKEQHKRKSREQTACLQHAVKGLSQMAEVVHMQMKR